MYKGQHHLFFLLYKLEVIPTHKYTQAWRLMRRLEKWAIVESTQ